MKNICFYFLCWINFQVSAQSMFEYSLQIPREKVYLNLSKPYYFAGENLNLQATIADARTLRNDTLSVPLYVELIDNKKDSLVGRWILKIVDSKIGTTLRIPDNLTSNYYQIRAYTNWMRNFSKEAFFQTNVLIFSKNYKENIPNEIDKTVLTNLNAHPESGVCVKGLVNNLYVQTTDNYGKGIKSIVSLKSDTSTIRTFDTDEYGKALVEFEPVSNKNYYLESGALKTSIPKIKDEGVILRGYYTSEVRKLTLIVQNNFKVKEPLKLMMQTRGNNFYNTLIEPNKVTFLNFKIDSLPEGILNTALIDLDGKIISQRLFLNVHQDRDDKQNYLLFNSELNVPVESTDKLFSEIRKVNVEMINKRNVVYGFDELRKVENLGNNFIVYKNELGISIEGKITDKETQKSKDLVNVSLVLNPEARDTINKKQFFAVSANKQGYFSFDNLEFYGKINTDVKATFGKKNFDVSLQNDSIPPIIHTFKPIDWRNFKETSYVKTLNQNFNEITAKIALEEKMKTKELDEVTVTSKKTPRSPLTMFVGEPSVRFSSVQMANFAATQTVSDFFYNKIYFRVRKHLSPIIKIFVDDAPIPSNILDDAFPLNSIAYMDVFDGTAESNLVNASIVLNIYTKAYSINPMVAKMEGQTDTSPTSKAQRIGYYLTTLK